VGRLGQRSARPEASLNALTPLAWATLLVLLGLVLSGIDLVLGIRRIERLADLPSHEGAAPLVSLVVAARDEERNVESAARSLLAQTYPALEIIAVDDRSTDRTGAILDGLAAGQPRLRVVHVAELPPGWLGKNYALSLGAAAARGEWLLFADADVVMAPDAVSRAVAYAERRGVDHLTILPDTLMPGLLLKGFVCVGIVIFGLALRPWKARDPKSRHFVGVGAFNLIRVRAYTRAGGHEPIRLRPDDDIKLGKILKRSGARQDALAGIGMVSVEWYRTIGETIDGLMKNSFSVVQYNPWLMLAGVAGYLILGWGPLAALALGAGPVRLFGGMAVAVQLLVHLFVAHQAGLPKRAVLLFPVVYSLFAWIVLRALVLNLHQGGIVWRGTFYPLEELRKNRV
jgi:glycosyltransferase involved in cell wall biosynthesis